MTAPKYPLDGEMVTLKALKQRLPAHGEELLKWAGQNGATTTREYVDACERRRAASRAKTNAQARKTPFAANVHFADGRGRR